MSIKRQRRLYGYLVIASVFAFGLLLGSIAFGGNRGVDLAPNGMAYCPADSSTPHPTPCMFRQP